MNLAAIVASAFAALPSGLKGSCSVTRTSAGVIVAATDERSGDVKTTMAGLDCVVAVPAPDRALPDGLTVQTARLVSIPAAQCVAFLPAPGDVLTLNGADAAILEVDPVDPSGAAPALVTCLVRR